MSEDLSLRAVDRANAGRGERELLQFLWGPRPPRALEGLVPPFPWKLQVQTISRCNASCVMCPWPRIKDAIDQGRMPERVFDALLEQCTGRGVERFSLYLENEPLLDVRLPAWTRRAREALAGATIVIYTNGWLLSPDKARELAAAGVGEVNVSLLAADPMLVERYSPGTPLRRILCWLEEISLGLERGQFGSMRITVAPLDLPGVAESFQPFAERWAARGLRIYYAPVTNRAGHAVGWGGGSGARRVPCQRPFTKAYVAYDGRVVLCNCDWRREVVLGNILERPLAEIWRSPVYDAIRARHLGGELEPRSLCARCDYPFIAAEEQGRRGLLPA